MKLAIGSAQFGLDYGVTNAAGQVSPSVVDDILNLAVRNNINYIDTAAGYGNAEQVLGRSELSTHFDIVSKLPAISEVGFDLNWFDHSLKTSLSALKCRALNALLVHKADDLLGPDGDDLWAALLEAKKKAQVKRIGFSVYTVEQTKSLLEKFSPDLIQFPLSLLDQRFLSSGMVAQMARHGIALHARSIFLQGLLLTPPAALPAFARGLEGSLLKLDWYADQFKTTRLAILIGFVQSVAELEAVVVGVTSAAELNDIIYAWHHSTYLDNGADWAIQDTEILNPSRWNK